MSNAEYQQNAAMIGIPAGMQMGAHNAAYNYKNGAGAALYAVPPYQASYATLPHKAASIHQSSQNLSQRQQREQQQQQVAAAAAAYSTMSRMSYFSGAGGGGAGGNGNGDGAESLTHQHPHQHQPYIIYSDDKAYR